ncbi:MAG: class I SAM-dependent methyltransferase [Saprospiraceae bacterium]
MFNQFKKLLSIPSIYHYARQILLLGMPLRKWAEIGNYYVENERIADLGCGPSDILRYIDQQQKPAFYLGVDVAERYLKRGEELAKNKQINSQFIHIDLGLLNDNHVVRDELIRTLNTYQITTVNLFGVLHHIDDPSVMITLNLVFNIPSVKHVNTQDVLMIENNRINNFYSSLDRGHYIRTEKQYDELIKKTNWLNIDKKWTKAGMSKVKYIHYQLSK